jgi:hypothetical protein
LVQQEKRALKIDRAACFFHNAVNGNMLIQSRNKCLGCAMIRLVLLLCASLYVMALVLGADNGQKRYGLMTADDPAQPAAAPAAAESAPTVFIPAQPVMQTVVQSAAVASQPVAPSPPAEIVPASTAAAPLPAPQIAGGILYSVAVPQANVRDGPGRSFAVTSSLAKGEQVLVIPEDQPIEGWSRIRIEGDGVEGYISTSLLTPSP